MESRSPSGVWNRSTAIENRISSVDARVATESLPIERRAISTARSTSDVCAKKRAFDVFVVAASSILWIPAMAFWALAIRVFEGAPVFYRSVRRVYRGESARITKFRTMVRDADRIANRKTIPVGEQRFLNIPNGSPLHTRTGRIIERFHFTEIPQFLQVLSGELSLVGNRPLPEDVIEYLRERFPDVEERFSARSGMTGPVQLIGRSAISDADRLCLEYEYCRAVLRRYSVRLDMLILLMTVPIALGIVRSRSVDEVRAMMQKYSGPAS
jgi:lipopolysaccharide/colanic/teichoic acid biosynthesis glycosyltransferase